MDLTQNFKELFIAKDVDVQGDTLASMVVGEVGLFTLGGQSRVVAGSAGAGQVLASATTKAVLVKRRALTGENQYQISDVIDKNYITSARGAAYAAKVEQVSYIGFNGTSGALDATNDNTFQVRFVFDSLLVSNYNKDYFKHLNWKSAISGTTQEKVAKGLVLNGIANFEREPDDIMRIEQVSSGANSVIGTGVDNVTFTKGSKTVTASGDFSDSTGGIAVVAGSYLRIGTALTSPVYKVASVESTTSLTLDTPFQGETTTLADTAIVAVTGANVTAGDMGLKFTGISKAAAIGRFLPSVTRFEISLASDSWVDTAVTYAVGPNLGNNTAELIAADEFYSQGNQGDHLRYGRDTYVPKAEAEDIAYNSYSIAFRDDSEFVASKKQAMIAYPDGASNDVWSKATDGLQAVLNAFLGTSVAIT